MQHNKIDAGIDVGSLSAEAVLLSDGGIVAYAIRRTGANPLRAAESCLQEALDKAERSRSDVRHIVATGYGRLRVPFAHREVTEITCHARGAHYLFPKTRTVVDIGGQDSKVITLNSRGEVTDFVMNDRCAAGTGRFLEVMADALETELSQLGDLSVEAKRGVSISSMCTVFAESEVISLIADGLEKKDIIRGVHESIARRIFRMTKRLRIRREITFTGGVAKNKGMVAVLERLFKTKLNIPQEPQVVGALGAALLAREMTRQAP
ncbi:MAG: 2-hydroxyglutaryl-CoA dehydratase [Deltaproteobacteria bacterium]|nr:2-hydroxyglutaryl-CoA dehydratase [Deltaproteobacteria bacterium]MBW1929855.1 2-hydroxyglutaryl-CoA dehydratase [Deltaproteobacteria bacterium]MBW2025745.1 2-hydroxyglutaryl-CoA dehydratase [Deltaproteobacteria bacterium]MBW2124359.1 2-hydroxyglutaryl-CoA dehydratase [Deltaproteobacteria bacterium]RLB23855.1 MAG: 2-hydroxyglutaryl-CoA dehydratase [Deltaproteobacteria bacterium]